MTGTKSHGLRRGLTHYGDPDFALYLRRSFARSMGYGEAMLERPVVGICNTASGFNNCHRLLPELIEAVKRGVLAAGGLPLEFPTISLGEPFLSPTSLMFRNLMSMDVEEMIRAQPMDAVVLVGRLRQDRAGAPDGRALGRQAGDPGGRRADDDRPLPRGAPWRLHRLPALLGGVPGRAHRRAEIRRIETRARHHRGHLPGDGHREHDGVPRRDARHDPAGHRGHPGGARRPAARRRGERHARRGAGPRGRPTPRQIVTPAAVDNALRVLLAIGGSTNGILHLAAIAGRVGIEVPLERFNELSDQTPVLVDLKPTGPHYMEDLFAAGGLGAVLRELGPLLHLGPRERRRRTLGARSRASRLRRSQRGPRPRPAGHRQVGGLVALFGSLAPGGAILKRSAADARLFEHEGRAVVFESLEDLAARIDDPDLEVAPDDVLVLQNAGPKSGTGMPEAGYLPIPGKLARAGVKDMIRISDARMSGTAFGTIVLHVTPEAALGGPLGLVRSGDRIRLSVRERRLDLLVGEEELARRRAALPAPPPSPERGYARLYHDHVLPADRGCDFDFLRASPT